MVFIGAVLGYVNSGCWIITNLGFSSVKLASYVIEYVVKYLRCVYRIFSCIFFILSKFYQAAKRLYDFLGIAQLAFSDKVEVTSKSIVNTLESVKKKLPIPPKIKALFQVIISFVFAITEKSILGLSITLVEFRFYLLWVFIVILYKFIGQPLIYTAANPQEFYNNAIVVWLGTLSSFNIGASIINAFIFMFNVLNPMVRVLIGFTFKVIVLVLGLNDNYNPADGVPRDLQDFIPSRPELASHAVAHRQLSTISESQTMNPSDTYTNAIFVTPDFSIGETVVVSIETPIIFGLSVVFEYILFIVELYMRVFAGLISIVVSLITDIGSIGCCFITAKAFGFCLIDYILRIIVVFVRLIKLPGTEGIVNDILASNPVKSIPGAPCICAKKLPQVPACRPPTYTCDAAGSGDRMEYISYKRTYPNDNNDDAKSQVWRIGSDRSVVCREYIANQARSSRSLIEVQTPCQTECFKGISDSWKFRVCGTEKTYIGACDRNVPPSQAKKHLNAYLKMPFVTTSERQQLVYGETIKQVAPILIGKPNEILASYNLDTSKVSSFIHEVEAVQVPHFDCTIDEDDKTFVGFALRLSCLLVKFVYSRPWILDIKQIKQLGFDSPHIRSLLESKQEERPWKQSMSRLFATHVVWFNQTYNQTSMLVKHGQVIHDIASNISSHINIARLLSDEGRMESTDQDNDDISGSRTRANLRNLQASTGVFSQSSPRCPYLCPDGITCVELENLKACTISSGNWTASTVVRTTFHAFTVLYSGIDFQQTLTQAFNCWFGYVRNPDIDPTTLRSVLDILINGDWEKYIFCLPLLRNLPYSPLMSWSLEKYVEQQCGSTLLSTASQGEALQKCTCPAYITTGTFDYYSAWTPFSRRFVSVRLYNAWKEILFVLTRWTWYYYLHNIIYGFLVYLVPSQTSLLDFFNPDYGTTGYGCFTLYIGHLLWFLVFIVFPFFAVMYIYWKFLADIAKETTDFLYAYYAELTIYLTIRNHMLINGENDKDEGDDDIESSMNVSKFSSIMRRTNLKKELL